MKEEHTRTIVITPDWMDASVIKDEEHGGEALHISSTDWCIKTKNEHGDMLAQAVQAHCDISDKDYEPENIRLYIPNPSCTGKDCALDEIDIFPLMSDDMKALVAERIGVDYSGIIRRAAESRREDGI